MQNFPKRKNPEMRAMVCAPPGYKLIAADYGQLEARLIACASRDPNLVDALWTNYDIHAEFAHLIAELVPDIVNRPAYKKNGVFDFKKLRHDAKNKVVFPLFYGSVAESVARDLIIAEPIAKKIATNFWKRFGGVQRWQHDVREFYAKHGYVECLTGRQRPGPLTQNMIINTPIQGTASDLVVDGMDRLARTSYEERIDHLTAALNIHDDLTFWVPEGEVESSIEQIVVHMLSADFDWLIVPISIEVSVGDNWYEMHEVGTFESHKLAS